MGVTRDNQRDSTRDSRVTHAWSHATRAPVNSTGQDRTAVQALSETAGVAQPSLSSSSPYHGPCSSCQRASVDLEWFATRIGRFYCEACGPAARHEARGTTYRVVRITQPPWTEDVMTRERDRADARRAQETKEAQTDER